jgi:hypothetical protein
MEGYGDVTVLELEGIKESYNQEEGGGDVPRPLMLGEFETKYHQGA